MVKVDESLSLTWKVAIELAHVLKSLLALSPDDAVKVDESLRGLETAKLG